MRGPTSIFWANLTPFSIQMHSRGLERALAGTTRLLIMSSRLELLAAADHVVVLHADGSVKAQGK
jgi:hypothetical protein